MKKTPAKEPAKKKAPVMSEKTTAPVKTQRDVNEAFMGLSKLVTRTAKENKPSSANKKSEWGLHRRTHQRRGQMHKCKGAQQQTK